MASKKNPRVKVKPEFIVKAIKEVSGQLNWRIKQKGSYSYSSPHEAFGVLTEEWYELLMAVHQNNTTGTEEELKDIAVCCIFALAGMKAKKK